MKKYKGNFFIGQKIKYLGLNFPTLYIYISDILYCNVIYHFWFYFIDINRNPISLRALEIDLEIIDENQLSLFEN